MPPHRLSLFYRVLGSVQPLVRRRRMQMLAVLDLKAGDKVIDLGGTTQIWNLIETPLDITVVNLPGVEVKVDPATRHKFHFVAGDATDLAQFPDNHFDLVFSNSVIEHVGGEANERAFAREARRLAQRYYVQTPSIWFPLEPHSGVPFWWLLPKRMRQSMIDRWRKKLPDWTAMIEGTTVITRRKLRSYFPDGTIFTERLAGIPKSYVVYRNA
jgi:hypothetical protein